MITFTKEQLIASAHARIEFAEMMLAGELEPLKERTWSIELELARIALASLEAEPVLYAAEETLAYAKHGELHLTCLSEPMVDAVIPLYTAPPAPVAVPDDVMAAIQKVARIRLDLNDFDGDKRGILDCLSEAEEALIEVVNRRAAMLQGASGNSPVIPDGWVPCSERLPEETKDPDGGATGYLVLYAEGKEPNGGFNVGVWNVTYLRHCWRGFITHWQPLPAAPQ